MDRLICPDCGKLFTSKRSLFGHKKEKHSGPVEVFPCVDCGKNFSRKANLKVPHVHINTSFTKATFEIDSPETLTPIEYNIELIIVNIFRLTEIHYTLERNFPVPSVKEYLPTEVP